MLSIKTIDLINSTPVHSFKLALALKSSENPHGLSFDQDLPPSGALSLMVGYEDDRPVPERIRGMLLVD
jgi:hypothetical protein